MGFLRRCGVVAVLCALGCSGRSATPDAADASDAAAADAAPDGPPRGACTCCMELPFTASQAFDVASDGTTIYVAFVSSASSPRELGIVSGSGGEPTMVAVADQFVLAAFQDAVFYAALSGSTYEVHQRVGSNDRVLGSVTSLVPIQIAANATDLYVFGSDAAGTSTLWRFSRSGNAGTMPAIVATASGNPAYFALGSTVAAWATSTGSSLVSLPGPSTPTALSQSVGGLVFSGDLGFVFRSMLLTSHASRWSVDEILPTSATIYTSSVLINGGLDELQADANHVYWRLSNGSEATPNLTDRNLVGSAPDGTGLSTLCNAWPSNLLRQDATHLYGLENTSPEQWFVDVIAKP